MQNKRFKLYELKMYYDHYKLGSTIAFIYFDSDAPEEKSRVAQMFIDNQTLDQFDTPDHVLEWAARRMAKDIGDDQFYGCVAEYVTKHGKGHLFHHSYDIVSPFDKIDYYPAGVYDKPGSYHSGKSHKFAPLKVGQHKAHVHIAIDGTVSKDPVGVTFAEDVGANADVMAAVDRLPGISAIVVHPVSHEEMPLRNAIIDLNDTHRWTRERVADWMETLDIDLRFKSEDDTLREQREKKIAELEKQLAQTNANIKTLSDAMVAEQDAAFALVEEIDKLKEEK